MTQATLCIDPVSSGPEVPDPYRRYRYSLLSSARIRELSALRPIRVLADILLCWTFILAAIGLVVIHTTWWSVPLAFLVIGNRYYALFIIGHDGMHRRLFPNVKRNDFWTDLFILAPIGAITRINNRNHLLHHRYLATADDPDRRKHTCFGKADGGELIGFLSGLSSVWHSGKAVFLTNAARSSGPGLNGYTMRDFLMIFVWFGTLSVGLTWLVGWWAYPLLWLLPVYTFMFLADNFRSFAEHSKPESDAEADAHRLVSYSCNFVESMFFAPMNMNLHAVHHLWPSIPYYNLPIADREIRSLPESVGLEWRDSYVGYLLLYWISLPLEQCRRRS